MVDVWAPTGEELSTTCHGSEEPLCHDCECPECGIISWVSIPSLSEIRCLGCNFELIGSFDIFWEE